MIETLILSALLGIIGGAVSYYFLNKINSKYVKNTKIGKTIISITNSVIDKNNRIIHITDNKKDVLIEVTKSGINYMNYAEY